MVNWMQVFIKNGNKVWLCEAGESLQDWQELGFFA